MLGSAELTFLEPVEENEKKTQRPSSRRKLFFYLRGYTHKKMYIILVDRQTDRQKFSAASVRSQLSSMCRKMHSSGHLQERKLFKNQIREFTRRIKSPEPVEENNTQGAAGASWSTVRPHFP